MEEALKEFCEAHNIERNDLGESIYTCNSHFIDVQYILRDFVDTLAAQGKIIIVDEP